jgi:hypothetical protein
LGWAIRASRFTILYDSCVLYPAPLRDLLMQLALTDLFRAKWTNMIHDEWIRSLLRNRPDLTQERLRRTRDLMNECVRDCIVEGFEPLIEALSLPDPDDRHVLAAGNPMQSRSHSNLQLGGLPCRIVRSVEYRSAAS